MYNAYKHRTKRCERHCSNYVNRIRNQFIIKETEKNCTEAIENGLFLFYHKGNPLVSKDKGFIPIFADRSKIEDFVDQSLMSHESAFLSISDEEYNHRPLFAVALPKELEEKKLKSIETTFGGAFTNLRLAMMSGKPGCNIFKSKLWCYILPTYVACWNCSCSVIKSFACTFSKATKISGRNVLMHCGICGYGRNVV